MEVNRFSIFLRKAFIKGMGYSEEMLNKPIIGITNTYSDYKKELNGWKDRLSQITKYIRWAHSNRKLRRMHKIKDKSALSIPTYSFEINDYVANM